MACTKTKRPVATLLPHTLYRAKDGAAGYRFDDGTELAQVVVYELHDQFQAELQLYAKGVEVLFTKTFGTGRVICTYENGTLDITNVYLDTRGVCTKSVAYTIYALIDCVNARRQYAPRGTVHILSSNPCAAFNCYDRAFRINGFEGGQYAAFQRAHEAWDKEGEFSMELTYASARQAKLQAAATIRFKL